MLITPAGRLRMPAGRARPGTLHPRDIKQKSSGAAEQAKGRATGAWPRRHQPPDHDDRRRQYWSEGHCGERSSGSEERPSPEPATAGEMSATRCPGPDHPEPLSDRPPESISVKGSIRMSEAENLFGEKHVRRYRENGGEVGHRWKRGSKILLLTTKGRKSGEPRTTPLIYEEDGDRYVIVASKGGAPAHPGWYRNLQKDPNVELQVLDEVFPARARTAEGEERERLWQLVNQQWPDYDSYQTRTDREIPVVVLERTSA